MTHYHSLREPWQRSGSVPHVHRRRIVVRTRPSTRADRVPRARATCDRRRALHAKTLLVARSPRRSACASRACSSAGLMPIDSRHRDRCAIGPRLRVPTRPAVPTCAGDNHAPARRSRPAGARGAQVSTDGVSRRSLRLFTGRHAESPWARGPYRAAEAQLDRFLLKLSWHPTRAAELQMLGATSRDHPIARRSRCGARAVGARRSRCAGWRNVRSR